MGTNYYLHSPACEHCGRSDPPKHIGKCSHGWCFFLHVGDGCPESLEAWREAWSVSNVRIVDEYGDGVHPDEMWRIITKRSVLEFVPRSETWYRNNHAIPGPNGLARCRIDGERCIGHGEGTWDLIRTEFS